MTSAGTMVTLGVVMRWHLVFVMAATSVWCPLRAVEPMDYAPLGDNYEWTMNASFVSAKGPIPSTVIHRKVEGKQVVDGKSYYRLHHWNEGGASKIDFIDLTRKDATGVYWIHGNDSGAAEQMLRMLPMKVGQTWEILWKGEPMKLAVVGMETVTIDGKVYENCVHVHSTLAKQNSAEDDWEAPNVGTVKSEVTFPNGTRMTLTLKEFKPGK